MHALKFLLFFLIVSYALLEACPCVGVVQKESPPFFDDTLYEYHDITSSHQFDFVYSGTQCSLTSE